MVLQWPDIWYVSSSFTGSAAPISSNWAQYGLHNSGTIGGSMTQSSEYLLSLQQVFIELVGGLKL
ncbi:MAG: hypothetical protein CM15mV139_330 [Caudoviricetes sp.]|nr:MAG: hypothetical protein CM15mV139_330 [Caudoviricetes sp.]